jgi:SAM-dependent MidA family methyltransferase
VDVAAARSGMMIERRVTFNGERFQWIDGEIMGRTNLEDGTIRELQGQRLEWLDRIDQRLERGFIFTIDYGYTDRELVRFPQGTLMRYKKHRAYEDVLTEPGTSDITAHVAFTDLQQHGERLGWSMVEFEPLARMLMRAGEADEFAAAIAGSSEAERARNRMQLKSLLFGMGETFRVLVQRKG